MVFNLEGGYSPDKCAIAISHAIAGLAATPTTTFLRSFGILVADGLDSTATATAATDTDTVKLDGAFASASTSTSTSTSTSDAVSAANDAAPAPAYQVGDQVLVTYGEGEEVRAVWDGVVTSSTELYIRVRYDTMSLGRAV